ncbi:MULTISPECIES: NUDIX domain-containing protein [Lachnospiraceae]|uniref:NUDIX hydrolase n=1 Tax=Faecalicatena acetigenes TaxID=2981790 RepID=A0ABT2TDB5_9FIRM|nr:MULTISPECIES: NUDIX hydrolase [Lachnospiraceae]MCU6748273.1 NUDIX hydrolase [Faecalicatena acetigenes]RGT71493.1 NUDIX hydrolase [Ruminococcus sp. AF18-22]SCI35429.1 Bifunctional NMN adenylyltransferase/Nudix hydrolase [uncultured Clostridium sp.]
MPAFLKDVSLFQGTGERDEKGQTLEEFLEKYDPYKYKTPCCTTDAVVFSYNTDLIKSVDELSILLVKRRNHPSIGFWGLPGGFIDLEENLDETARRELEEETGVYGITMEQLGTWGNYDRDPRARVITTAYMALVKEAEVKVQAGDDAADALWWKVCLKELDTIKKGEWLCTEYLLQLENKEKKLRTEAVIEKEKKAGIICEQKFYVRKQGQIAADHAAIIVQALLKLKKRL